MRLRDGEGRSTLKALKQAAEERRWRRIKSGQPTDKGGEDEAQRSTKEDLRPRTSGGEGDYPGIYTLLSRRTTENAEGLQGDHPP